MPTAGTLASDMSADSDGGKEDKAPAHVSNKTAHIKTMPENSNYEKSELDKFVLKVIPKDNEARNLLTTTVKAHLLFTSLDDETISKIVGAMDRVECETGAVLITQGDTGAGAMCESQALHASRARAPSSRATRCPA